MLFTNDKPNILKLVISLLVIFSVVNTNNANSETTLCKPIKTIPFTIKESKVYCLKRNFKKALESGNAITIEADNVVLDLNGHSLDNTNASVATEANGIYALNRQNIHIKNGTVSGFFNGIFIDNSTFDSSRGHIIEKIYATRNTGVGVKVHGEGCVIRNNLIVRTGGSTFFNTNADGISVVSGTIGGSNGGNSIINNDIIDTFVVGLGESAGIDVSGTGGGFVINNRIMNSDQGIIMSTTKFKYRDNLTLDVTNPYVGGIDLGNNN